MKNALLCTLLFCSVAQAHEPYVAPLAYHTENTQVPVLSAYAEQAFHPEYALKVFRSRFSNPTKHRLRFKHKST